MKIFKLVALLCLGSTSFAGTIKMKVSGPDGLNGTATMVNKIQDDGSKYIRLDMRLKFGDGQVSDVLQESIYDKTGLPVRMLQTSRNGTKKTSIVVTFTNEGAQVVSDQGDGPKTNMVLRPSKGSIANLSQFWFSKIKPEPGATMTYFVFRTADQSWLETKTRFVGDKEIIVLGKTVKAHLVQTGELLSYFDDEGDPIRIELSGVVLELSEFKTSR